VTEQAIAGGTFSAELVPQIDAALRAEELTFADVSAIAVVVGPGSFTGLRVGLAAVKGLCEVRPLRCVAVSALELIAATMSASAVTTMLDAGRSEAYVGRFTVEDGIARAQSEELVRVAEIKRDDLMLTPDASIAAALGAVQVPRPRASDLAQYAVRKLERGITCTADELDAHYIRRSDAEIFSKPTLIPAAKQSR
jgi:tRNA threonylcarbamoyladenosine biosynthesis protein TsaB